MRRKDGDAETPGEQPSGRSQADPPALVFRAGAARCALPLTDVVETMRPLPVLPLAAAPPYVRGVSVVRGVVVPVVDAAALLGTAGGADTGGAAETAGAAGPGGGDGADAPVTRFVTVRGVRGEAVLATGPVLGVRHPAGDPGAVVAADGEPLLLLRADTLIPGGAWEIPVTLDQGATDPHATDPHATDPGGTDQDGTDLDGTP